VRKREVGDIIDDLPDMPGEFVVDRVSEDGKSIRVAPNEPLESLRIPWFLALGFLGTLGTYLWVCVF
jgi:hypothetical protein